MKTKQERRDEAWEEYMKIINPAYEEYLKKLEEIDTEEVKVCSRCGK